MLSVSSYARLLLHSIFSSSSLPLLLLSLFLPVSSSLVCPLLTSSSPHLYFILSVRCSSYAFLFLLPLLAFISLLLFLLSYVWKGISKSMEPTFLPSLMTNHHHPLVLISRLLRAVLLHLQLSMYVALQHFLKEDLLWRLMLQFPALRIRFESMLLSVLHVLPVLLSVFSFQITLTFGSTLSGTSDAFFGVSFVSLSLLLV